MKSSLVAVLTGILLMMVGPTPTQATTSLELKQAISDFVGNVDRPVDAADIVSFLEAYAIPQSLPTPTFGPAAVFNNGPTSFHIAAAKLSTSKFVVAYRDVDNSNYGTAVVGEVSGTSISYGPEYVFNSAATSYESVAALSASKFVVVYQDVGNSSYGTAIIGDVSGTNISYGSEYVFNSATTWYESVTALSNSKFVVVCADVGNSGYGTAVVGEVSGTSISYGSKYAFNSGASNYLTVDTLSASKFVVAYQDASNSQYGTAVVGEVSGTSISYGSEYVFNSSNSQSTSVSALSASKFVVAYQDVGNASYGTAIIGEISGTSISYGSEYVFNSAITRLFHSGGISKMSAVTFVVGYENLANSDGRVIVGTVAGNSISFDNQVSYNVGSNSFDVTVLSLSASEFIVAWGDQSDGTKGKTKVGQIPAVNLGLTKSVSPATAIPGQVITYTLAFSNSSAFTATNVVITDTMPVTLTNISVISRGVAITDTGITPPFAWDVQDLTQNETGYITITGKISSALTSESRFTNTATITTTIVADVNTTNNSDEVAVDVILLPDLGIDKMATDSLTDGTTTITYTITISNHGKTGATGVIISDTLPVGTTFVASGTTNGSSYNPASGIWDVGTVEISTSVILTIVVTDNLQVGQTITNIAALSASTPPDSNASNNSDSASVTRSLLITYLPIIFKNF